MTAGTASHSMSVTNMCLWAGDCIISQQTCPRTWAAAGLGGLLPGGGRRVPSFVKALGWPVEESSGVFRVAVGLRAGAVRLTGFFGAGFAADFFWSLFWQRFQRRLWRRPCRTFGGRLFWPRSPISHRLPWPSTSLPLVVPVPALPPSSWRPVSLSVFPPPWRRCAFSSTVFLPFPYPALLLTVAHRDAAPMIATGWLQISRDLSTE